MCMYVCVYICVYICVCIYVYMCVCMYVWVCVYIYIYVYIRGVTNTQGGEYDTYHEYKVTNTTIYS